MNKLLFFVASVVTFKLMFNSASVPAKAENNVYKLKIRCKKEMMMYFEMADC
jgi:hypothetical protein